MTFEEYLAKRAKRDRILGPVLLCVLLGVSLLFAAFWAVVLSKGIVWLGS